MKSHVFSLIKNQSQWLTVGFTFIYKLQYDISVLFPNSEYWIIISEIEIAILDKNIN
jgi:hypothetical protein